MILFSFILLLSEFSLFLITYAQYTNDIGSLEMVSIVFRHGQKASDPDGTYPNDPLINETYYPYGPGELTNIGKRMEYILGRKLRKRYNDFLGNNYTPDTLYAVSTHRSRAKMSLQLVLAGLYPPDTTPLEWNSGLNWQPIPFDSLSSDNHVMGFPMFNCPKYIELYNAYMTTPSALKVEKKYNHYYPYLAENMGVEVKTIYDIFFLYLSLDAEKDWGLDLPQWTKKVFPTYLKQAAMDFYVLSSGTPQLKQFAGGFLLKKIIGDCIQKIDQTLKPPTRKMFLYSGHEYNVAFILNALNVYYPHIPNFGASAIIELHNLNGLYGIKVFYADKFDGNIKPMKIPGCKFFCELKTFLKLVSKNLPKEGETCNLPQIL